MPCRCDGYPEPEPDVHNNEAAEALCAVMREHEERGEMGCFTKDQLAWWVEHKKRDAMRIAQDERVAAEAKARADALAKLTPADRQALGLR